MNALLNRYGELLCEVDGWFATCQKLHPGLVACRQGCSACCRGLFDITLLDALNLKRGFDQLPGSIKEKVLRISTDRLSDMSRRWPDFSEPWILNGISECRWDQMMPEDDDTPCLLLSDSGACLLYDYRPMTCRLNGIPPIDLSGEKFFDEWCTLNFINVEPLVFQDIRHPFKELFIQEQLLFRELTRRLFGREINEMDTIIPAAVFMDSVRVGLIHPPAQNHAVNPLQR
jgi:Fe-S-cluster containining protein